jgi:TonB family protein
MEKTPVQADFSGLRGDLLSARSIMALMCLLLAGCVRPAVQSAPSAVIPCQFSPAETWRGQPCTGDCTHRISDTPPAVRDSAAVTARLIRLRTSARGRSGWYDPIHVRTLIDEDGSVQEAKLRKSSGNAQIDEAALSLVRRLRFAPRKVGHRSVRSLVDLVLPPTAATDPSLSCTLHT